MEGSAPEDSRVSTLTFCLPIEGYYLHMDASTFPRGGVARLRSPDIWEQGPLCIHFAFHMFGLSWGAQLRLMLLRGRRYHRPNMLWKYVNTQSPSWMPTKVTVPADRDIPSWVRLRADLEVWERRVWKKGPRKVGNGKEGIQRAHMELSCSKPGDLSSVSRTHMVEG